MILVDANLLIYAVNEYLPLRKQAKAWWEKALSDATTICLPWVSVRAFLRICTNSRVFPRPLAPEQAIGYIDEWLAQSPSRLVAPGSGHWPIMRNLLQQRARREISPPTLISPPWPSSRATPPTPPTTTSSASPG